MPLFHHFLATKKPTNFIKLKPQMTFNEGFIFYVQFTLNDGISITKNRMTDPKKIFYTIHPFPNNCPIPKLHISESKKRKKMFW